jgi:hypothetical protein
MKKDAANQRIPITIQILLMEQLFSYGTLQSKEIQMQVFNKLLSGTEDQLAGYKLKDK